MANLSNANSGTIAVPHVSQPIEAANAGRTYWSFQNLSDSAIMWLGIGVAAVAGPGSTKVLPGRLVDSSTVPQITQAAVYVLGNSAGEAFTFQTVE